MLNKQAQQDYGDDPLSVRESGKYQEEYVHAFVDKWDELIDWDGRAKAEGEFFIENSIRLAGVSAVFIIALIFIFLLREGLPTFLDIPLRQLFGRRWYPIEGQFGILSLLFGSTAAFR